jgi:hypothetical protein
MTTTVIHETVILTVYGTISGTTYLVNGVTSKRRELQLYMDDGWKIRSSHTKSVCRDTYIAVSTVYMLVR